MARLSVTLDAKDMIATVEEKAKSLRCVGPIFVKDTSRQAVVACMQDTFNHLCDCQRAVLMQTKLCIEWNGGDVSSLDYLWICRPFFGDGDSLTIEDVLKDRKSKPMADERWLKLQRAGKGSGLSLKVMKGPLEGFWNAWYFSVHVGMCEQQEQKGYLCVECGPLVSVQDCKCVSVKSHKLVVLWPKAEKKNQVCLMPYDEFLLKPSILAAGRPRDLIQDAGMPKNEDKTDVRFTMRHVQDWARTTGIKSYENASRQTKQDPPTKKSKRV